MSQNHEKKEGANLTIDSPTLVSRRKCFPSPEKKLFRCKRIRNLTMTMIWN
jgi:hypothetical protein